MLLKKVSERDAKRNREISRVMDPWPSLKALQLIVALQQKRLAAKKEV